MRALAWYVGGGLLALSAYCPLMFLEHTGPAGFISLRTSTGDCIPGEQGQKLSVWPAAGCRAILSGVHLFWALLEVPGRGCWAVN